MISYGKVKSIQYRESYINKHLYCIQTYVYCIWWCVGDPVFIVAAMLWILLIRDAVVFEEHGASVNSSAKWSNKLKSVCDGILLKAFQTENAGGWGIIPWSECSRKSVVLSLYQTVLFLKFGHLCSCLSYLCFSHVSRLAVRKGLNKSEKGISTQQYMLTIIILIDVKSQ